MRNLLAITLGLISLAATANCQDAASILSQETVQLAVPPGIRKTIALSIAVEQGSGWQAIEQERPYFLTELQKASKVLEQCGLGISQLNIMQVALSPLAQAEAADMENRNPNRPPFALDLMEAFPETSKPLVLFLQSGNPHSFNAGYVSRFTQQYGQKTAAVKDVAYIGWEYGHIYNAKNKTDPSFSIVAHELVHVLSNNSNHLMTGPANLMRGKPPQSAQLNRAQCAAILAYPGAKLRLN